MSISKGCQEVLNKVMNEKALNKWKPYTYASYCHYGVAGTEMHYSASSQGKIDDQNATMCLSVLNWINDLLVSMFLGGHSQKKKKGPILIMNSGQVVDCLVLFFLNLILESRRKMETVHSCWCT